jgi:hypothetical protein
MNTQTYQDAKRYMENILKSKEKDIENIMHFWLMQSCNSEMFFNDNNKHPILNIAKAEEHLKIVQLYRLVISNDYSFKYKTLVKPEPKSINPNYNAKVLREYQKAMDKENKRKLHHDTCIAGANKIITELNIPHTISELKNDFEGNRIIVKNLFRDVFSKYGIVLHENVMTNLFGKIKFPNDRKSYDSILFFTGGTRFNFSLNHQFSITTFNKANGIFSAFFMRAAGCLERFSNNSAFPPVRDNLTNRCNNPFYEEKTVMRILASAMACTYR